MTRETRKRWGHLGWTWTTGGCFAFCEAFVTTFGGEPYGLCLRDPEGGFPVEHAVARLGEAYFDYTGRLDIDAEASALARRRRREIVLKAKDEEGVFWFEDDFIDDEAMGRLHEALAGCLPARAPRP